MKKKCFKCGKIKLLTEFYKHPKMPDGHLNKCKTCNKADSVNTYNLKKNDPDWVDSERIRGRKKYHKYKYKSDSAKYQSLYKKMYPEKYAAKCASGHIKPLVINGQKHHWSYNEEHYKDVIHISRKNHAKAHRFITYDQERFMYRTTDGVLLDTREAHVKYILHKIKTELD